ncbi:DUF6587 family protein [Variovorax terrae]|uniref:Uncharacterized protein n=1 Tax=Variovorax terrae TaxID=2923278 RepID=A0A9X1VWH2_9BURK|nr:DUF6587 family protein [Variovorax terrae]MCJ0764235.1 hypothetical protein [Variovorax terrae]
MGQQLAVGLIVLAAALYALWHWMPARWRRALAARLASGSRRLGVQEEQAQRMAAALGSTPGCGACDSCGSCATPGAPPAPPGEPRIVQPPQPHRPRH